MEKLLNQFQNDEHIREAVKEFMYKQLDVYALEAVYAGKDTKGIANAKQAITDAFTVLAGLYDPKKVPVAQSPR